jgi:hypothetical protein
VTPDFDRQQRIQREVLLGLIPESLDTPEEAEYRRRYARAAARCPSGSVMALLPDWDEGGYGVDGETDG